MPIWRVTGRPGGSRVPWRELERLRDHLEGMYGALTDGVETVRRGGTGVYPLVNISEDDLNLYVTAELPGVNPEDLELSVHGENLTLRGERKAARADQAVNYHRRERDSGIFRRMVSLPVKIDPENIRASAKDGVLNVTLPKAAEAQPRQITVQPA